jgi:hypothetical protein
VRSATGGQLIPGPRSEFIDAFDAFDAFDAPSSRPAARSGTPDPLAFGDPGADARIAGAGSAAGGPDDDGPAGGGKGRTFAGIAAAAVITILAVVVIGQFTDIGADPDAAKAAGTAGGRGGSDIASRSDGRSAAPLFPLPAAPPATYSQLMARQFPLSSTLQAADEFAEVAGFEAAPGKGQKFRYRVDVENGLGLDGTLFAEAVQRTLNDDRSWAHNGDMTFERISAGEPDFVVTLASPGTTALWCAKSGLDTTVDNVSCDSASTDRVMINAYRWAQGSKTYGDRAMFMYRQMLINHEVGHRLGHNHVSCRTPGALAPVMQQQTKSLDIDGIKCRPNPWVYPEE